MGLEFRSKSNRRIPDQVTKDLSSFLIENTNFLNITFDILSTFNSGTNNSNMEENVKEHPLGDEIEDEPEEKKQEHLKLVCSFYVDDGDGKEDIIAYRRGDLLELLASKSILSECQVVEESQVYENNVRISEKDIDVVAEYKDFPIIECIECKANIKNYIGNPMDDESIDKLNFMKEVKSRAAKYNKVCKLQFATYREDTDYTQAILEENSFKEFEILKASDLIERLINHKVS